MVVVIEAPTVVSVGRLMLGQTGRLRLVSLWLFYRRRNLVRQGIG